MNLSDLTLGENGFLIKLRCSNSFDEALFADMKTYLTEHLPKWKADDAVPAADAVAIFDLIDELSGGSRFWGEEVEIQVEDALLDIQELIHTLEK